MEKTGPAGDATQAVMELRSLFHGPKPLFLFFLKIELIIKKEQAFNHEIF